VNNYLSQLGLTAQERRLVVGIFMALFLVLNYLFVWPSFGEWGTLDKQRLDMLGKIQSYNDVIKQDFASNGWKVQIKELTQREGGSVLEHPVDPQVQLQNTIRAQERKTGVYVKSMNPGSVKTNEFFEEQSTAISLECQEPQLVGFLYHMGMDQAMIRVSMLNLSPADANTRYRLQAKLTLTANYIKKQPTAVNASAADKRTAAKPGAAAATKPRVVPAPAPGQPAKHQPGGSPAPGNSKPAPGGRNVPIPGRPVPPIKNPTGQKVAE
jgi:hypothetical protein